MPTTRSHPQPKADPEREQALAACQELAVLWSRLEDAIAKDSAGSEVGGKGRALGSPATINVDVVDASVDVQTRLAQIAAEVVRVLNLDPSERRTIVDLIAAAPAWYDALHVHDRTAPVARSLADAITRSVRVVKAALGLRTRAEAVGRYCPDHPEVLVELIREPDEADLAGDLLATGLSRMTETDDPFASRPVTPPLRWRRGASVRCPYPPCGRRWSAAELLLLDHRIKTEIEPNITREARMKLSTHWTQTDSTHPNNSQAFQRLVAVVEQKLPDVIDRFPHLSRRKAAESIMATLAHNEGLEPRKYRQAAEAVAADFATQLAAARDTILELSTERDELADRLDAIRELHRPNDQPDELIWMGDGPCPDCGADGIETECPGHDTICCRECYSPHPEDGLIASPVPWPCPTIRALGDE